MRESRVGKKLIIIILNIMSRRCKRFVNKLLHNFQNFLDIMQDGSGITLKNSVISNVKSGPKGFNNYYRTNS